jgi:hypothetical protein
MMGKTSVPCHPLTLIDCATIAEEVEADLDRVAVVVELIHGRFRDPSLEVVQGLLLGLARKLERGKDALYAQARAVA